MKRPLVSFFIIGLSTVTALANLTIPRGVFSLDKFQDAQAKAIEDDKPIAFVMSDPGTT